MDGRSRERAQESKQSRGKAKSDWDRRFSLSNDFRNLCGVGHLVSGHPPLEDDLNPALYLALSPP